MASKPFTYFIAAMLAVLATAGGLQRWGAFHDADHALTEMRMGSSLRPASRRIVYLAIDKKSLDSLDSWPWPRGVYADILDALSSAGATDIFLDVDFSSRSTKSEDKKLADALKRAGGSVLLPAFLQLQSAIHSDTRLGQNLPLPEFRENAWLASVNVMPDSDGIVRTMNYGVVIEGEDVQSVPSMLSTVTAPAQESFSLNFSVDPATVPVYSVKDLLEGRVGFRELNNKTVVVGAHAVELRDTFTVPVHGLLPGPLLQIIAAETLHQDIAPITVDALVPAVVMILLILVCVATDFPKRLRYQVLAGIIAALSLEALAFLLHARLSLTLPTMTSQVVLTTTLLLLSVRAMDWQMWLTRIARTERDNGDLLLRQITQDSQDAILVCDEKGQILEINNRALNLFSSAGKQFEALEISTLVPDKLVAETEAALARIRAGAPPAPRIKEIPFETGGVLHILECTVTASRLKTTEKTAGEHSNERLVVCVNARDVTERRQQAKHLEHLSRHDDLTGALRRHALLEILETYVDDGGRRKNNNIVVFAVNLHRFRTVNSTLGRGIGNQVLIEVQKRLKFFDARFKHATRLGGDTFALVASAPLTSEDVLLLGKRLARMLESPVQLKGTTARVGTRIGICMFDADAPVDAETLLERAETAVEEARQTAGTGIKFFDDAAWEKQATARQLERELWFALRRDQISLNYQPQIDLATGETLGVEALVRWNHPALGSITTKDFIDVAEANGFVEELGRWVLHRACIDAMRLDVELDVAVNISPLQFLRNDLIHDVRRALKASSLPAHRLTLEITESSFVEDPEQAIEVLNKLRTMGIKIALDDFGTGFSSLAYLSRFPLDKIKIDRSFVTHVVEDETCKTIIRSVKTLADGLKLDIVCEGIETKGQRDAVRKMGCRLGQGYLFCKPLPLDALADLLAPERKRSA